MLRHSCCLQCRFVSVGQQTPQPSGLRQQMVTPCVRLDALWRCRRRPLPAHGNYLSPFGMGCGSTSSSFFPLGQIRIDFLLVPRDRSSAQLDGGRKALFFDDFVHRGSCESELPCEIRHAQVFPKRHEASLAEDERSICSRRFAHCWASEAIFPSALLYLASCSLALTSRFA